MTFGSMCAAHPNAPSVVTCRRCGRFCCTDCLPLFETCPECATRAALAVPPLEGRAMVASLALWACAGVLGVRAAISVALLATGQTAVDGALGVVSRLASVSFVFVFLTTAVLVSVWFHRATRHALARGAVLEVSSPAGAVASWFIPILNFVWPFNITRSMLASAGLDSGSVGAWQGMWIAGYVSANAVERIGGAGGLGISVLSDLLMVGAGITGAQVVNQLKWPSA